MQADGDPTDGRIAPCPACPGARRPVRSGQRHCVSDPPFATSHDPSMTADKTHDPALRSVLPYEPGTDFPIQNLPFGVAHLADGRNAVCTRIGDCVIDLAVLEDGGVFNGPLLSGRQVFAQPQLNAFMALGPEARREARATLSALLGDVGETSAEQSALIERAKVPLGDATMRLPADIPGYTDFYCKSHHAGAVLNKTAL